MVTASLTVVAMAVLGLALWWPPRRDAVAQRDAEAATPVTAQDAGFLNCNAWPSATVADGR